MFGIMETVVILAVVFLFFGARKLPQLSRALGESVKEFKRGLREEEIDVTESSRKATLSQSQKESFEESSKKS